MATTTKTIDIHDPDIELTELISLVRVGVEVLLTDQATPLGRLVPVDKSFSPRIAGLHAHLGPAWMSDNFDVPLLDKFWVGSDEATAG